MKKNRRLQHAFMLLTSLFLIGSVDAQQKPRLTVIIVVDQLTQSYIQNMKPYFKHGLRELIDKGVYYPNAYIPHAMPATGTGHAGLNTGTYAKDHGIIRNSWMQDGELVKCDDDTAERAAVFSPTETYDYGKSAHFIMVDGISDQFMLQSRPEQPHYAFGLSIKSRSSIGSANKLGKAIWFDDKTGLFTSSKAYFEEPPIWLQKFNATQKIDQLDHVFWKQAKPKKSRAYQFVDPKSNAFFRDSIQVGQSVPIEREANPDEPYHSFVQTPHANKLLFDLAQECIKTHINRKNNAHLLVWVDLSSLDKIGHSHGPSSREVLDMIYHLDKQLAPFMRFAQRTVGPKETLFVLTSDHGVAPIPELINQAGLPAVRLSENDLIEMGNAYLKEKHGLTNSIQQFKTPQFFFDPQVISALTEEEYNEIMAGFKTFLRKQPGIKQAWTDEDLENQFFEVDTIENYFKQQRYPGRSGSIFIQTEPYSQVAKWPAGTTHRTPYEHNTHIPLILYQHGSIELKTIGKKVSVLQLANTLADILQIPKPSASIFERLPGIDEELDYLAR